jgi:hypothetical protein
MQPVLRGQIKFPEDGRTIWEGRWGMNLAAFEDENSELLNIFRYTCATRVPFSVGDTVAFKGYFEVSSTTKGSKSQFTDKQLDLEVMSEESEGGMRTIKGHGSNRFGNFDISGTFNPETNVLEVRRIYGLKPVQAPRSSRKQTAGEAGQSNDQVSTPTNKPKTTSQPQSPSSPTEVHAQSSSASKSQMVSDAQPQQPDLAAVPPQFPVDISFYSDAKTVLRELKGRDVHKWFSSPVDAEALGLRDYHGVIKTPMDLGTIQTKLDDKRYASWEDCLGDMRLTFVNALMYNPRSSLVYKAASDLSIFLDERVKRIGKGKLNADQRASIGKRAHKKKKFFEPGDQHDTAATAVLSLVKKTPKSGGAKPSFAVMTTSVTTVTKKSKKLDFSKVKRIKMSSSLMMPDESLVEQSSSSVGDALPEPLVGTEGYDSFDELDEKDDVFMTPPPSDDEDDVPGSNLVDDTPMSNIPLIPDYNGYGAMSPTNLGDADDF